MVQNESEWPLVKVLPSYGRGRDAPGGRYSSLIFGTNLTDVVITGDYFFLPFNILIFFFKWIAKL